MPTSIAFGFASNTHTQMHAQADRSCTHMHTHTHIHLHSHTHTHTQTDHAHTHKQKDHERMHTHAHTLLSLQGQFLGMFKIVHWLHIKSSITIYNVPQETKHTHTHLDLKLERNTIKKYIKNKNKKMHTWFLYCNCKECQELCGSRGGHPGLSVLTSLLVSVDVKNIESCFGIGLGLSLICQPTSEDIKQHYIPNTGRRRQCSISRCASVSAFCFRNCDSSATDFAPQNERDTKRLTPLPSWLGREIILVETVTADYSNVMGYCDSRLQ